MSLKTCGIDTQSNTKKVALQTFLVAKHHYDIKSKKV